VIWSRYSILLAVSLAAMAPAVGPLTSGHEAANTHTAQVAAPVLTAADALARAQAACAVASTGIATSAQVGDLVRLLGDDTRVESPDCGHRGWGNGFGPEPAVCLSSPAQEAARALARLGRTAVAPLVRALADPAAVVRRHAAVAVGLLDDDTAASPALPTLLKTLGDADWQVRRDVVWALGESGDGTVVPAVSKSLSDAHPRVRVTAAQALGEIEDTRAVDALVTALKDEHPEVREMAAWALGELKQARAVPGLVTALKDQDWRPRVKAAWALGEISSADGVDGLVGALKDDHARVREMAAWALGEIGSGRAVPALVTGLSDQDWEVRAKSAWALGEISDTRAADPLAGSMKDPHPKVRKMAAWALAETLGK
jgi:HEAT repeat protein